MINYGSSINHAHPQRESSNNTNNINNNKAPVLPNMSGRTGAVSRSLSTDLCGVDVRLRSLTYNTT